MLKDEETAVVVLNEGITQQLERHFAEDASRSKRSRTEPSDRSFFSRLISKVLRPVKGEF
jgi:hypothetical protein